MSRSTSDRPIGVNELRPSPTWALPLVGFTVWMFVQKEITQRRLRK
ncbi:hypothetical protein [Streptosporangium vulgare]|uniref:Uncharacterized protein n=1 Tax=Streptosporangium vulgare TaxID=46190 RepID=A0ABV5TT70_9ACTN